MPFFKFGEIAKNDYVCIIFEIWMLMAEYRSKYRGEEVDALLDKIAEDNVGDIDSALSLDSENPVMNKVITEELNKKVNKTNIATINGQTLTNGGNIEVSTDAYDDTEIKGKLTELQSKVGNLVTYNEDGSATINNGTRSEKYLPQSLMAKWGVVSQTITINADSSVTRTNVQYGWIPVADINDYAIHDVLFNDTDADIERTAPWGSVVLHKVGCFYCNGLGDISHQEMMMIHYDSTASKQFGWSPTGVFRSSSARTIYPPINTAYISLSWTFYQSKIECLNLSMFMVSTMSNAIEYDSNLRYLLLDLRTGSTFTMRGLNSLVEMRDGASSFHEGMSIPNSPNLSINSVVNLINSAVTTKSVIITLHATAYARAIADADVQSALDAHPNVSLAQA